MTERRAERSERAHPVLVLAHEAGRGEVDAEEHRRGRERLLVTLASRAALPRSWRAWWVGAAAAAAVALLVLWPQARLAANVEGAAVTEGAYVAPAGTVARIRFEEGSEIAVAAGARGRLAEIDRRGARFVLEEGRAELRIVTRPDARWSVHAGPYVVRVTGTAFTVGWDPGEQTLEIAMDHGAVVVVGPLAAEGVRLGAGQRLVAQPTRGRLHIDERSATSGLAPSAAREAAQAASSSPRAAAPVASVDPRPWSERVAGGEFAAVVAEAEARGLEGVLASAALADLVALADAARYAGRVAVARRALEAQRTRFAGTTAGRTAAFLLGRIADDVDGAPRTAAALYDQYLAEGGGAFAAEALGRKMLAQQKLGDLAGARATAVAYLERHPRGPHAAAAGALVSATPEGAADGGP
jgi:hypothetical protein